MWQLTPWLRLKAVWGGLAMQSDTQNAMQWQVTAKLTPTCHDRQSLRGNKTSGKALYLDHKGRLDMLRSVRTLFSCYCFSFVQRERESLRTKWGSWFVVVLQHSPTNMHEKSIREVFFFLFLFLFFAVESSLQVTYALFCDTHFWIPKEANGINAGNNNVSTPGTSTKQYGLTCLPLWRPCVDVRSRFSSLFRACGASCTPNQ